MVAIGSAVTVDALSSFRGVMSVMSGTSLKRRGRDLLALSDLRLVATYCWLRCADDVFWFAGCAGPVR